MYYDSSSQRGKVTEKMKEGKKKKHLEFRIQIVVSIKDTGTRENILKRHY